MADDQVETTNAVPAQQGQIVVDLNPELRAILDLERERIQSTNKRTDAARAAIVASDAADQRHFNYRMEELKADDGFRLNRLAYIKKFLAVFAFFVVVMFGLMMYMAFWGEPGQSAIALEFLKFALAAAAGWGVISGLIRFVGRLFHQ